MIDLERLAEHNVIPILPALVSLGGSAAINWFTRVRGASTYVRLLTRPAKWDITWMRFDAVRSVAYLGDHGNADNLYFTAPFDVAVGNSGPRSGVLLDPCVLLDGVRAPWVVPSDVAASAPETVAPGGEGNAVILRDGETREKLGRLRTGWQTGSGMTANQDVRLAHQTSGVAI
ncbi:MAG: hypothetical protein ACYDEA_02415 [Candidatus Dormibacteria bacterium]